MDWDISFSYDDHFEPSLEEAELLARVMTDVSLSKEELGNAATLLLETTMRLEAGDYSLKDAVSMWMDAIDRIAVEKKAMVCTRAMDNLVATTRTSMAAIRYHAERQATNLRVVDPMKDPGVWVIVDDACNSCVHGARWRKNAEKKFRMRGLQCVLVNHVPTDFTGKIFKPNNMKP